jgi:hypothetical protein
MAGCADSAAAPRQCGVALSAAAEAEPNHPRVLVDGLIVVPLGAVVRGVPEEHAAGTKG